MVKEKYNTSEIKQIINKLAKTLTANRITVDKIILYGSYSKGTQRAHSDIDIAIISLDLKIRKYLIDNLHSPKYCRNIYPLQKW
jgi:predicted nucleotidyltransferase